jgi:hypothetical protein
VKKVLMVIGVLALVAIGAVVFFVGKAKKELTPLVEKLLVDCRDGKTDAVYDAASEAFRKAVSRDDFRRFVAVRTKVLGAFKAVEGTSGGGMSTSDAGTVGKVNVTLAYERGTSAAEFQFVKDGDTWRLLHLTIPFDEKLAPVPDRAELEARSRALLDLYSQSSFAALYARFHKALQDAWKVEKYEPEIRDLRAKTGAIRAASLRDTKDGLEGKVLVTFDLEYERGPGDAVFSWVAGLGEWHLLGFDLHAGRR